MNEKGAYLSCTSPPSAAAAVAVDSPHSLMVKNHSKCHSRSQKKVENTDGKKVSE